MALVNYCSSGIAPTLCLPARACNILGKRSRIDVILNRVTRLHLSLTGQNRVYRAVAMLPDDRLHARHGVQKDPAYLCR